MKKVILLATVMFMCSQALNAQEQKENRPYRQHASQKEWIEKRVDYMDKTLDLTDAQEQKIAKVYAKYLDKNYAMTEAKVDKLNSAIKAELTPKQIAKYEELIQNRPCQNRGSKNCPHAHQHPQHQCENK